MNILRQAAVKAATKTVASYLSSPTFLRDLKAKGGSLALVSRSSTTSVSVQSQQSSGGTTPIVPIAAAAAAACIVAVCCAVGLSYRLSSSRIDKLQHKYRHVMRGNRRTMEEWEVPSCHFLPDTGGSVRERFMADTRSMIGQGDFGRVRIQPITTCIQSVCPQARLGRFMKCR